MQLINLYSNVNRLSLSYLFSNQDTLHISKFLRQHTYERVKEHSICTFFLKLFHHDRHHVLVVGLSSLFYANFQAVVDLLKLYISKADRSGRDKTV